MDLDINELHRLRTSDDVLDNLRWLMQDYVFSREETRRIAGKAFAELERLREAERNPWRCRQCGGTMSGGGPCGWACPTCDSEYGR